MKKEIGFDPLLDNSGKHRPLKGGGSSPHIRHALLGGVGSVCCLITLTILLAVPITVLVIGVHYRDPRYCPIEPRISLFLIVHGSFGLGLITLAFVNVIFTLIAARQRSVVAIVSYIILSIILILGMIFAFVWLIIGSVWTFSVNSRVVHRYDTINHFYPFTYCNPVLYQFTFVYIIISYVFIPIQCCYQCYQFFTDWFN